MEILGEIAERQAAKKELDEDQVTFLKSVMETTPGSGLTKYGGWYPSLFYGNRMDSCKRDVLVVDIHKKYPLPEHGDPGGVLHLGVGDPALGFFIVNEVMYAGPLFSSYELMTPVDERLTDKEFKMKLPSMSAPEWTGQSYLRCIDDSSDEDDEGSSDGESEEDLSA
ncbi:hypothetical protein L914_18798 [Phytophthora nicotianae]|uniref:Uncharacterized protein n=1 Tax=Phytophthora nicotianae TaxID=4792 RepID=W2MCI0_PHYNI|nr:hypothetical protein L914_18798 [Phytophthora nicotianae]